MQDLTQIGWVNIRSEVVRGILLRNKQLSHLWMLFSWRLYLDSALAHYEMGDGTSLILKEFDLGIHYFGEEFRFVSAKIGIFCCPVACEIN